MNNNKEVFVKQRDNHGAMINRDHSAYHAYIEQRNAILNKKNTSKEDEINNLKEDVKELKSSIDDIKNLLVKVLESK